MSLLPLSIQCINGRGELNTGGNPVLDLHKSMAKHKGENQK